MTNYLNMTNKDLDTLDIIKKVSSNKMTQIKAWEILWLSDRQIRRKKVNYLKYGPSSLIHKARWKPSNNKKDSSKYNHIIKLKLDSYHDYNISHFCEKLLEKHNIKVSMPTLRNELIKAWIHKVKNRKTPKIFEKRERRQHFWELVQYDWSYHKWLEDRNWWEELCLLVSVDDATWNLFAQFDYSEGMVPTFRFWKLYSKIFWKPREIYLDKFATYKINHKNATNDKELPTQFWRVAQSLGIKLIFANSPQGKWRVERMNSTLQDRLVKELREHNISDINLANKFLIEKFLPKFNKQFTIKPKSQANLHISLSQNEIDHIDQIFSKHSIRKLKNDFTVTFFNTFYQCYRNKHWGGPTLYKWDIITVEEHLNWDILLAKNWKYLTFKKLPEKRKNPYKLPIAPVNSTHFEEMKLQIDNLQKIDKIKSSNNKNKKWNSSFKFWKAKFS